jgi:hypothetical protein
MAIPTLSDEANAQLANPSNPWLQGMAQQFSQAPAAPTPGTHAEGTNQITVPEQTLTAPALPQQTPAASPAAAPPAPGGPALSQQEQLAQAFPSAYKPPEGFGANGKPLTPQQQLDAASQATQGLYGEQRKSVDERQKIAEAGAQATVEAQAKRDADDKLSEANLEALQAHGKQDFEAREAAREAEGAKLRAMHTDPQKWFKDRGTAGSILAALSIGAGAFAAAMPHSGSNQNVALGIITKAVDRDVEAQQGDIDKKFKELDLKGRDDEKAYIRDQHDLAQKRQAKLTAYDHAQAMVNDLKADTQNAVAIKGLDDVSTAIGVKQQDEKKALAEQHMSVLQRQQAAAAAAANAEKEKQKQITELAAKHVSDPNFQPKEGMSREEAALRSADSIVNRNQGNMGNATVTKEGAASKDAAAAKESDAALDIWRTSFDKSAKNVGYGTAALGAVTPGGTAAQDAVEQHTATTAGLIKNVEPRMNIDDAYKLAARFTPRPGMSAAQISQAKKAGEDYFRANLGIKGKNPGEASGVDGAEAY